MISLIFRNYFCIVLKSRVIREKLILSIPLPERTILHRYFLGAIFHSILPRVFSGRLCTGKYTWRRGIY